jgi:hypothetical protein
VVGRIHVAHAAAAQASGNGIWLCAAHGKQVDDDLWRFSADTLREWKAIAEARARSEH